MQFSFNYRIWNYTLYYWTGKHHQKACTIWTPAAPCPPWHVPEHTCPRANSWSTGLNTYVPEQGISTYHILVSKMLFFFPQISLENLPSVLEAEGYIRRSTTAGLLTLLGRSRPHLHCSEAST